VGFSVIMIAAGWSWKVVTSPENTAPVAKSPESALC